jgi:predicted thioesterase
MKVGDSATAELVVQPSDTAQSLALTPEDEFPNVFATSRMIALMEVAASRLMKPMLEEGQLSVGVSLNVRHTAATPIGSRVETRAIYEGPEGKLYKFRVEAFDEAGPVGAGEHTRAIVSTERLLTGASKRKAN